MAKRAVAKLRTDSGKGFSKVIRMTRSEKSGAYTFTEEIIPTEMVKEYLSKK